MFKHRKIKKLFNNDDPKLVYLLRNKNIDLSNVFKDVGDLLERSIQYHKNTIAETELMAFCDDINKTNEKNQTYLMIAIAYDNHFMFNKLLEKGIRLDILDNNRESALYYALRNDNISYFRSIINHVEIKGFNNDGANSAIYAYLHNKKQEAIELLEKGDFINHIDKHGNTILHYAAIHHDTEFAFQLLELGADLFIRNYEDKSVLDIAKEFEMEELLIEKVKENFCQLFEDEATEHILELFESNNDMDDYDHFNIPFLIGQYAIKYNNDEVFNRVIRQVELLNHTDYEGKSLLMYCLKYNQILMAKKILYLDVDLNVKDESGMTAAHHLMHQIIHTTDERRSLQYIDLFKELIDCQADMNVQDREGNTVLMIAIEGDEEEVIDLLLNDSYIDLNLENEAGKTALLLAYERKKLNIVQKIIMSNKVDINHMDKERNTLLLKAMMDDDLELFSALLHYGANLDIKYNDGLTILMIALELNKIRFIAKIFEYPFNVDLKDDEGNTALMHAIRTGSELTVKALLKLGANKRLTNKKGNSPIYLALDMNEMEIARLLKTTNID